MARLSGCATFCCVADRQTRFMMTRLDEDQSLFEFCDKVKYECLTRFIEKRAL